jgi:hypothetical protein
VDCLPAKVIASIIGYSDYWFGRIARRHNQHGPDSPDGVNYRRHQSRPSTPLLSVS